MCTVESESSDNSVLEIQVYLTTVQVSTKVAHCSDFVPPSFPLTYCISGKGKRLRHSSQMGTPVITFQ